MPVRQHFTLPRFLKLLVGLLIVKILISIALSLPEYIPPNFDSNFLLGRDGYFWNGYHWAFYSHLVTGPCSLIFGMILLNQPFLKRFPKWHRFLGCIQGVNILCGVVPTGLWMAWYAAGGPIATAGFVCLAFLTGFTMIQGWRTAVRRRFELHRCWMQRCFLLLCSTVIVRVNGGIGDFFEINAPWFYIQIAWTSWLIPLLVFEVIRWSKHAPRQPARHFVAPTTA